MSAREMFDKLRLEYISINYEKDELKTIMYHDNRGNRVIMAKDFIECRRNYNLCPLDAKYLPAVIKQYKEFGWYD